MALSIDEANPYLMYIDGVFYSKDQSELVAIISSMHSNHFEVLPTVSRIGPMALYGCGKLQSIKLPMSITEIGPGAFSSCMKLTSIEIPESVKEIGPRAFADCTCLETVVIPDSVEKIASDAFQGCPNIKEFQCCKYALKDVSQDLDSNLDVLVDDIDDAELDEFMKKYGLDLLYE